MLRCQPLKRQLAKAAANVFNQGEFTAEVGAPLPLWGGLPIVLFFVDGCTRAAPCGRGAAGEVRSSCAGANTTNKHTRTYTEVLCIQGFDLSPSHAVSTQFGVEMKLLTRASERFWVRDPPMWTRISRFNSCQQQLGLHVIRRRVRYPRRKCEISFWEGDVLGFKSHSLHRTNREKGRVKFHFYSKSSADWMKTRFAGYMGW